jgi:flagellar protein FliL
MAKPNEAKDIKPKEGEEKAPAAPKAKVEINENTKVIIINLITTLLICVLFLSVTYVLMSSLLSSKLAQQQPAADANATADDAGGDAAGGEDATQKGFIVDLGDFILNLSDVSPRRYLKINVALEISQKPEDAAAAPAKSEHGGEGASAASPLDAEMEQYKPAMRDAVITTLSSKSAGELATVAGKELAKEQITQAVNGVFNGEREVLRVSFGQFIIQ